MHNSVEKSKGTIKPLSSSDICPCALYNKQQLGWFLFVVVVSVVVCCNQFSGFDMQYVYINVYVPITYGLLKTQTMVLGYPSFNPFHKLPIALYIIFVAFIYKQ